MQTKRQRILEILKEKKEATVGELAAALNITSVTVRHHLDVLRSQDLVGEPEIRHRSSVGRPEYIYTLTERALDHFPKNYANFTGELVAEMKTQLPHAQVERIFRNVAQRIAAPALPDLQTLPYPDRVDHAVAYLNDHGYMAHWETTNRGYVIYTSNCPYETVSSEHPEMCLADSELIGLLLGSHVQRVCHLHSGDDSCGYLINPVIPANLPEIGADFQPPVAPSAGPFA